MDVLDWLLDADPAIRWQVLRDLTSEPPEAVARERARVATEGWGARLLALQASDGLWSGNAFSQDRTDTFHVLELLRRFGLDPDSPAARAAIGRVKEHVTWGDGAWWNPPWAANGFFDGEVEPCINGNVVATGSYFGVDVAPLVERLLGEQLADGGWNCEVENGAVVASVGTTINVLEGLLAFERATGGDPRASEARRRGDEYLLERRLLRRKSTGELIDPAFSVFSFPTWWHYDVLRALDYLRSSGHDPADERLSEAVEVVRANRGADGRWPLGADHGGESFIEFETAGEPSRWITLGRCGSSSGPAAPAPDRADQGFGCASKKSSAAVANAAVRAGT